MTEQEHIEILRDHLNHSYEAAKLLKYEEAVIRISRAIAAYDAPTDIDIFVKYPAEI